MKSYIVIGDDNKYHIVKTQGFTPKNVVCPAPEGEEIEWLEIVEVKEDENNPPGKMVIINQDVKQQVLEARAKFISDNEWLEKRQAEYPSLNDMTVALWEKVVEARSESADLLQAKRLEVKNKYPKPGGK